MKENNKDPEAIRQALYHWMHSLVSLDERECYFITVTFREYDSFRRINRVAEVLTRCLEPDGELFVFAEQGEIYGRIHAHCILTLSYRLSLEGVCELENRLNVRFGRSEVERSQEKCLSYCIKYATKEQFSEQWGVWKVGEWTGDVLFGFGRPKDHYLDPNEEQKRLR